jgi:hypothetical protein
MTEETQPMFEEPSANAAPAEPPSAAEPSAAQAQQPDAPPAEKTVPLARLQGVQRQLSQVEKDRDTWKQAADALQSQLADAHRRAAQEYAERVKLSAQDIVPALIAGDTIEQVEQSIHASRAAFAAASAHYARTLPTPVGKDAAASQSPAGDLLSQPEPRHPVSLISQGLRNAQPDINQ